MGIHLTDPTGKFHIDSVDEEFDPANIAIMSALRRRFERYEEIEQLAREAVDVFAEFYGPLGLCTECAEALKQLRRALGDNDEQ